MAAPGAPPESKATPTASSTASSDTSKLLWEAQEALFVNSNPADARKKAATALKSVATADVEMRAEALFVDMEAAAVEADDAGVISAALRLCELTGGMRDDPRVRIAALRLANRKNTTRPLRDLAQNPSMLASLVPLQSDATTSQAASGLEAQHPPTCQNVRATAKFLSRLAHYATPAEVSQILGRCAPDLVALAVPPNAASPNSGEAALLPGRNPFLSR
jgi:hypothetical protein